MYKSIKLTNKYISPFKMALILSLVIHTILITLGQDFFIFNEINKNTDNIEYYQVEEIYFNIPRYITKDEVIRNKNNENGKSETNNKSIIKNNEIKTDRKKTDKSKNDNSEFNNYDKKIKISKDNEISLTKVNKVNNKDNSGGQDSIIKDSASEVKNGVNIRVKEKDNPKEDKHILNSDNIEEKKPDVNILSEEEIKVKKEKKPVPVFEDSKESTVDTLSIREKTENIDRYNKELINDNKDNGKVMEKELDENEETVKYTEKAEEENQAGFENKQDSRLVQEINSKENDSNEEIELKSEEIEGEQLNTVKRIDLTNSKIKDGIIPPGLLDHKPAVYPEDLRRRGIEGKVLLKVLIDREGNVNETIIVKSSGFKGFDEKAVLAVTEWMFTPTKRDGSSIESWVLLPVIFKLE